MIPESGRSPEGGHGNPLQYSCVENPPWTEEPSGLYYSPWGHKELDMTERLSTVQHREIKKTIPFTTTSKRINYQGINLMKEVKDVYTENYKTLLKETEDRKKDSTCP